MTLQPYFLWLLLTVTLSLTLPADPARTPTLGDLDLSFDGDGKVITTFGTNSIERAYDLVIQPDGKIVIAGHSVSDITGSDFALVRYNSDGSLDPSFGGDGKVTTDFGDYEDAYALILQPDGKLVAAGRNIGVGVALARYHPDGSLDTTFSGDGKVVMSNYIASMSANDLALQPDGKILAAGYVAGGGYDDNFALLRYNPDGSLDSTFDGDGRVMTDFTNQGDVALAVVVQPNGKIVVAGRSTSNNVDFAFARYNSNGSLDLTFDKDGLLVLDLYNRSYDEVRGLALQPDGKIVAAGLGFTVVRLNPNGSLDSTFDGDGKVTTYFTGSNGAVAEALALQSNGKIIVAGYSSTAASEDFVLARYFRNGGLDWTFGGDGQVTTDFGGELERAFAVAIQPDGRIVVAGSSSEDIAVARYLDIFQIYFRSKFICL